MTGWTKIADFQVSKDWLFTSPVLSNVFKFSSHIIGNPNQFFNIKGLLTLARFETNTLSSPIFLSPVQIIYPWVSDTQLIVFPEFVLPGTYRIATKISSGNLGSNVWSVDVWEYGEAIPNTAVLTPESLAAIQQLLIENNTFPTTLTPETIAQIAEAVNQTQTEYYPPG